MAGLTNNQAVHRWVQDHLLHGCVLPKRSYNGRSVRIDDHGALVYVRTEHPGKEIPNIVTTARYSSDTGTWIDESRQYGTKIAGSRSAFGPVRLAVYIPASKTFLLNGDGFTDTTATALQTFLRTIIQSPWQDFRPGRNFGNQDTLFLQRTKRGKHFLQEDGPLRYVIVPFEALQGADVRAETVRPIDVTEDTQELLLHHLPDPPSLEEFLAVDPSTPGGSVRYREVRKDGVLWRSSERRIHTGINPLGIKVNYQDAIAEEQGYSQDRVRDKTPGYWSGYALKKGWKIEDEWNFSPNNFQWTGTWGKDSSSDQIHLEIRARRFDGRAEWMGPLRASEGRRNPEQIELGNWWWEERVHQLGASLFSAVGEDGKRHKFVSAFDNQEAPPMYFLAQLPDGSGAKTYQQAMDALAPEIVHNARKEDRDVFRQGDVFAIETNLSDEEVYAMARTRVRRVAALWIHNEITLQAAMHNGFMPKQEAAEGEIQERVHCPCGCGKSKRVPWGPRCQRALSIYRTGHTATEVVTTKTGTTYIRGTMSHDPQIETPGRRAEHSNVFLGNGKGWYLCVRNSVPRRRTRTTEAVQETAERQEAS